MLTISLIYRTSHGQIDMIEVVSVTCDDLHKQYVAVDTKGKTWTFKQEEVKIIIPAPTIR